MSRKIRIDDVEYDLDSLSEEAKRQILHLQFVNEKLANLQTEAAVYATARIGYTTRLKELLEIETDAALGDTSVEGLADTITFDD